MPVIECGDDGGGVEKLPEIECSFDYDFLMFILSERSTVLSYFSNRSF